VSFGPIYSQQRPSASLVFGCCGVVKRGFFIPLSNRKKYSKQLTYIPGNVACTFRRFIRALEIILWIH
jgi:hypothetical protein